MIFKIEKEEEINSLKDIRAKKQELIQKADAKALKIKSKLDNLVNNTSAQLVFDDILEKFELQHTLFNFLPVILKYRHYINNLKFLAKIKNSPEKRALIIGVGALVSGIATYLYLDKKKQNTEEQ